LLAAIGEQFSDVMAPGDDVVGLSVSPRERDDLLQIWNVRADCAAPEPGRSGGGAKVAAKSVSDEGQKSQVLETIHKLMPDVRFLAEFYKRKKFESYKILIEYFS